MSDMKVNIINYIGECPLCHGMSEYKQNKAISYFLWSGKDEEYFTTEMCGTCAQRVMKFINEMRFDAAKSTILSAIDKKVETPCHGVCTSPSEEILVRLRQGSYGKVVADISEWKEYATCHLPPGQKCNRKIIHQENNSVYRCESCVLWYPDDKVQPPLNGFSTAPAKVQTPLNGVSTDKTCHLQAGEKCLLHPSSANSCASQGCTRFY